MARSLSTLRRTLGTSTRELGGGLLILGYHRVDDEGGGLAVSPEEFRAQLEWLSSEGYEVVDLNAPRYHPRDEKPAVGLTFDDGYRSVAEVAWPELRSRAWPAMLYVVSRTTRNLDRFTWDASVPARSASLIDRGLLLELASDGMSIGSHTRTHAYLPSLSAREIATEVIDSRRELEDALGREVSSFSYPQGGWNPSIRDLVASAGYRTAVTTDRGCNRQDRDPLSLRRRPTEHSLEDFRMAVSGAYDFLRPIETWRHRRRQAAVTAEP